MKTSFTTQIRHAIIYDEFDELAAEIESVDGITADVKIKSYCTTAEAWVELAEQIKTTIQMMTDEEQA